MTEQERIIRAGKAAEVVDNPVYQEIFNDVRERTVKALTDAGLKDVDLIVRLKVTLELLDQLQKGFDRALNDGKVAQVTLKHGNKNWKRNLAA